MNIMPVFASPIIDTALPNPEGLNEELARLLVAWEQDPTRKRRSAPTQVMKVAVYESDFMLFDNPDAPIQTLARFCLMNVGYVVQQLNNYTADEMKDLRLFSHSWYHLTRHGGYTAQHNHPMASWSGVYCVDPGESVLDKPNNGALRFLDMRSTAGMYLDPGNSQWREPFGFGEMAFNLRAGQLLLFPSYLVHEVAPYYGQRPRITVAFNVWVRHAGEGNDEPGVRVKG